VPPGIAQWNALKLAEDDGSGHGEIVGNVVVRSNLNNGVTESRNSLQGLPRILESREQHFSLSCTLGQIALSMNNKQIAAVCHIVAESFDLTQTVDVHRRETDSNFPDSIGVLRRMRKKRHFVAKKKTVQQIGFRTVFNANFMHPEDFIQSLWRQS
jgi:hypothetical protein